MSRRIGLLSWVLGGGLFNGREPIPAEVESESRRKGPGILKLWSMKVSRSWEK